jgi:hypothetical protein
VERLELAVGVPPFGGHRLELRHFGRVDGVRCGLHRSCSIFLNARLMAGRDGALYRSIMDKVAGQKSAGQFLYPSIEPFDQRMLDVGDGHRIYVEQCGNPDGVPVVVLHGGPGGGCSPAMRRYFDPVHYRIILFDQRGCGRSRPHASVEANTTWHLVRDIERIRAAGRRPLDRLRRQLGRDARARLRADHPERVAAPVLRGVFLMTQAELDWFYGGGAGQFWPDSGSGSPTRSPRTSATT